MARRARLISLVVVAIAGAAGLLSSGCPSLDGFASGADASASDDADSAIEAGDAGDSSPALVGYLSVADAARFCSKALTCPNLALSTQHSIGVPIDANNYSACVSWLAGQLPPNRIGLPQADSLLRCAESAGTCAAANACMWWEVMAPNDLRCAGIDGGDIACSPTADAIYNCSDTPPYIWHCNSEVYYPGSSCVFDDASASGGFFGCAVANGCAGVSPTGQCMGNVTAYCGLGDHVFAYDCSVLGLPCGYDKSVPTYDCLTNGKEIFCPDSGAPPACAGSVVSLCAGSFQGGIDCSSFNATCDGTGTPRCKLPGDTCSPSDATVNVCSGDGISLCVSGQPTTLDCTSIGLHCVQGSGAQTPHCG
jgi:hypothetical protein